MNNPIDNPPAGVRWLPLNTRPEWLENRRAFICASEASAICDRNNYTSLFTLAQEKVGAIEGSTFSAMKSVLTHATERVIDAAYREVFGEHAIIDPGEYCLVVNDDFPGCAATPDRLIWDPKRGSWGIGEWKTWNKFRRKDWKDGPPMYIQIQVQHQLMCSGLDWAVIGVLFGFDESDFQVFLIERDDAFIQANHAACVAFLEDCKNGIMPVVDASKSSMATLAILAPVDDGGIVILDDDEWAPIFNRVEELEDTIEPLQKELDGIKAKVKAHIGEKKYAIGSGYGWTFSTVKGSDGYLKVALSEKDMLDIHEIKYSEQKGKSPTRSLNKKRTTT